MSEPTENDLIRLEIRDLLESVGELRLAVGALMERVERLEQRPTVGIGGEWVTTETPVPRWGQA